MAECKFPMCTRHAEASGWCLFHAQYSGFTEAKPNKPIKKIADTRKETEKLYKQLSKQLVTKFPDCQVKSPKCTGKSQGCHHTRGRLKDNILNEKTLIPCCNACNGWIEDNHAEAERLGLKKSKFKTE